MLVFRSEDEVCRGAAGYVPTVQLIAATQQCGELVFVLTLIPAAGGKMPQSTFASVSLKL